MSTQSVLISETEDPDENQGEWPYPNKYRTYRITGELADRVLAKAGTDGEVTILETEISGGYSEYTQGDRQLFRDPCRRHQGLRCRHGLALRHELPSGRAYLGL